MKHTLAVRRSDVTRTYYKYTFDFLERRVLAPQTVGRLAVLIQCTVGAHTSCWAVGLMPTTTYTLKTSRSTKSSVPLFVNVLGGGCTPFLSSALDMFGGGSYRFRLRQRVRSVLSVL